MLNSAKCQMCGSLNLADSPDNYALSTWNNGPEGITLNVGNFMPVKVKYCRSCGHINLKIDNASLRSFGNK
jgi:hypothetical protein